MVTEWRSYRRREHYAGIIKSRSCENYTIQWLFGLPEVVEFLHRHHVEEGGSVQVIQKLSNGLIIGANGERFAMGNEIADRIQV